MSTMTKKRKSIDCHAAACVLAVCLMAMPIIAAGQTPAEPLPIKTLLSAASLAPLSGPTFAPDGTLMAYTVIDRHRVPPHVDWNLGLRTGVPWNALGGDIWISDLAGGNKRNLTKGLGNSWSPSWSPDGKYVVFLSDRQSKRTPAEARLWLWDRASDSFRQLGEFQLVSMWQGRELEWTSDSRSVVVNLRPEGMSEREYLKLVTGEEAPSGPTDPNAVTAKVFSFDPTVKGAKPETNQGNLDRELGDLSLVEITTGSIRRISHGRRVSSYAFSPDRKMLAWVTLDAYERAGTQQTTAGLYVYGLQSGESRELVKTIMRSPGFRISWSPRNDAIAYQTSGPSAPKDDLYVVSVAGGAPRRVVEGIVKDRTKSRRDGALLWTAGQIIFGREGVLWRAAADGSGHKRFAELPGWQLTAIEMGSGEIWSPDQGRHAVVFAFNPASKRIGLAQVDLDSGSVIPFLEQQKHYDNRAVVTPDRQSVMYLAEDASHPSELWRAFGDNRRPPQQVSEFAPELTKFQFGRTGLIEWRDLDGNVLRGALLYPVGYEPGKRYPLVVEVYGGSDISSDLYRFGFSLAPVSNLQVFATRGYAVLYADSKQRLGTPMVDLLESVMPGVDRAIEIGLADPERIGLIGHSYGGYSTLSLIVQTRRFKAAVASAPVGNLVAAYGSLRPDGTNYLMSWAETGQALMGGTIWEFRDRYIENSPVFYLDRVTTPLLLINGSEDFAPTQADEVFSDMRRLGKRVEYVRYAGEDHGRNTWSQANQNDYLTRVIAWFDRYLRSGQ